MAAQLLRNRTAQRWALIFCVLAFAPISQSFAEDEYGGCAYGNSAYNDNCSNDAATVSNRPGGNTIGNPLPGFSVVSTPTSPLSTFTRNLQTGVRGEDVRALQKALNSAGFLVAMGGPGSPGNETDLFGQGTRAALVKFQLARGISPATGFFGPLTRAALSGTSTPVFHINSSSILTFSKNLYPEDSGEEVRLLQKYLNQLGFMIATSGPGSPGNETDYFGPATSAALKRFQTQYASEILTPNGFRSPTGILGPASIKKILDLVK